MSRRVCVVGSGSRFVSGISYFTVRLANAFAARHETSAILMRRLLPAALYPGRRRVGHDIMQVRIADSIPVFDGVDWFWGPTIVRAVRFLRRQRPEVVLFQWWTGTVLHSYLLLAAVARLSGAKVVVEFHETLDTGEAGLRIARLYVGLGIRALLGLANAFVVHSEYDRAAIAEHYRLSGRPVAVIGHGPFDHYVASGGAVTRTAPPDAVNLLFFGVIRPYKGLEDLLAAFDSLRAAGTDVWLTIVGETWEGWDLPERLVTSSPHRERITFVNRYVGDGEVPGFFNGADIVVLPYHRSSASGPLHIAMSHGLPVVITAVGGLTEVANAYAGAVVVAPKDPEALRAGIVRAIDRRGTRFASADSWIDSVNRFEALFEQLQ